jgi:hypothetical protein
MHTKGLAIFVVILVTFYLINSVINTFQYLILVLETIKRRRAACSVYILLLGPRYPNEFVLG